MDTAWIQVFVLTLAECVAPAGKTVCQEQSFELEFLTKTDCEVALQQFVTLKDASANVIVNKDKTVCVATAREHEVFSSVAAVSSASQGNSEWQAPPPSAVAPAPSRTSYEDRLENLPNCEDSDGQAPCKMGDIIVEAAVRGEPVEVWRRDN